MDTQQRRDRKYKIFWGAFLFATVMLAFGRLTGDQWVDFCSLAFMAYMAGNVGEAATKALKVKRNENADGN